MYACIIQLHVHATVPVCICTDSTCLVFLTDSVDNFLVLLQKQEDNWENRIRKKTVAELKGMMTCLHLERAGTQVFLCTDTCTHSYMTERGDGLLTRRPYMHSAILHTYVCARVYVHRRYTHNHICS
jgi:hypothetical protein